MENYTVCQLIRECRFEGFLLVRGAEKKTDQTGREYVDMSLGDRTGEINAKIWNWDGNQGMPESGKPIKVRGLVQEYNGRLQMKVENGVPLPGRIRFIWRSWCPPLPEARTAC